MFGRHVSRQLAALLDDELESRRLERAAEHLARCERCRAEREQVQGGMSLLERLPAAQAPEAVWTSIESSLRSYRPDRPPLLRRYRLPMSALAAAIVAFGVYWMIVHPSGPRWDVVRTHGAAAPDRARVGPGDWIVTDASGTAMLRVGKIGSVEVGPNTRLRVVTARPEEHRVVLARGEIRAKISAPPRLFFVDTASGTAVDLGCEYLLRTAEDGSGLLQVAKGWVSFQWNTVESLVPAGASCRTLPNAGPGVPYFDDAPERLQDALDRFGADKSGGDSLDVILREARVRDTLTLWHLLGRVGLTDRERVFDRIAALAGVPAGVSRQKVLELDGNVLNKWKDELAWTW